MFTAGRGGADPGAGAGGGAAAAAEWGPAAVRPVVVAAVPGAPWGEEAGAAEELQLSGEVAHRSTPPAAAACQPGFEGYDSYGGGGDALKSQWY